MEASTSEPFVNGHGSYSPVKRSRTLHKKLQESVAEQSPSTMLLLALLFGVVAGVVAFIYSKYFEAWVWLIWELVPQRVVLPALAHADKHWGWFPAVDRVAWVYTVVTALVFGGLAGVTQRILGSPGDLPDTIKCIHERGSIPIKQAPSMFICSAFSITAGGSLGPEAALLSLCGAAVSYVAKAGLGYRHRALRNSAIMGMTAGLAAFFGVALGGSLFALEVLHRSGMQFYEVAIYGIACGAVCLVVYRGLSGMPFGQVWTFPEAFPVVDFRHVLVGAAAGVLAAVVAVAFMQMHKRLNKALMAIGLHEHHTPVRSGLLGGALVGLLGVLVPQTMFWGEYEIQTLADPSIKLPHIWPAGGIHGVSPFPRAEYTAVWYLVIAATKLLAISLTVLSGFRGGFIFPLFLVGTSLGEAVSRMSIPWVSGLPPVLLAMCFASGLNTAITRTPLATPLILSILAGVPQVTVPCLAAALTALFVTLKLPFILTQRDRTDITLHDVVLCEDEEDEAYAPLHGAAHCTSVHGNLLDDSAHGGDLLGPSISIPDEECTGELPAVGGV